MLTENEIRSKLGQDYIDNSNDNISYSLQKLVERYATNAFGGKIPYLCCLTDKSSSTSDESMPIEDSCSNYYIPIYDDECDQEELREKRANLDMNKTLKNLIKAYPECVVLDIRSCNQLEGCAIFHDDFIYFNGVFYMQKPHFPSKMLDCKVFKEDKARIRYVLRDTRGYIDTHYMDIQPKDGFEDNYNDSLYPIHDKIVEAIHEDSSSLIILHGSPGTGKTSYIRHLIATNSEIKFYWLDSSMFAYIDTSNFIEFLVSCKNAVFILEDSESLLKPRDEGHNPAMQSLLSISDGMLGDSLKLKFICTFNTALRNIDQAILRKGRMKVKYEFTSLAKDKVEKIFKKLGLDVSKADSMPLSDVYNFQTDNGGEAQPKKAIGF